MVKLRNTHIYFETENTQSIHVRNGSSGSPKVVHFGINRKRVCDFLLVINSNLIPILHRSVSDIGRFIGQKRQFSLPQS